MRVARSAVAAVAAVLLASVPVRAGFLSREDILPGILDPDQGASIVLSPDGAYGYLSAPVVPLASPGVVVLRRDVATGRLTDAVLTDVPVYTGAMTLSPDGANLYSAGIVVFRRDPSTGTLAYLESQPAAGRELVISPDGTNLYAGGDGGGDTITAFGRDVASGRLTFVASYRSPRGPGLPAYAPIQGSMVLSPDGLNLYATYSDYDGVDARNQVLLVFRRDPASGALALLEVKHEGQDGLIEFPDLYSLAVSPDGRFVYAGARLRPPTILTLRRDPETGRLTAIHVDDLADPNLSTYDLVMAPDGSVLYAGGVSARHLAVLRRDPASGRVATVDVNFFPSAFAFAGISPPALTADGRDVYVTDPTLRGVVHLQRRCGDGVVESSEACDDGNNTDGDGCDAACALEPCFACTGSPSHCGPADGGPCDDGNPCTSGTTCGAGTCGGGERAPDGTSCDDGDACTAGDACSAGTCVAGAAPVCGACETCDHRYGCVGTLHWGCYESVKFRNRYVPVTGSLDLGRGPGHRALRWRWVGESPTTLAQFGNPMEGTGFQLCIFDRDSGSRITRRGRHVVANVNVAPAEPCAGGPCWSAQRREFVYHNPAGNAAGVRRIVLRARKRRVESITLVAGGPALGPRALPLTLGATAQLLATDGACWSADYESLVSVNTRARFSAEAGRHIRREPCESPTCGLGGF